MRIIFISIFFALSFNFLMAQELPDDENSDTKIEIDSTKVSNVKVSLKDGTYYYGNIISYNDSLVVFKTFSDIEMKIPVAKIKKIEYMDGEIVEGKFRRFDPNRGRLFLAPTAQPLDGGEGYLSICELFFPMISFGITKYVVLSTGMSLLFFPFSDLYYANIRITPLQIENFNLAFGSFYGHYFEEDGFIFYGLGTYGNNRN